MNLSYEANAERINAELKTRKGFFMKIIDRIRHNGYINSRLESIERIIHNDRFTTMFTSHYTTRVLFQAYLCTKYTNVRPDIFYLLKCHDLCNLILRDNKIKYSDEFLYEFLEVCPTFYWEQKIDSLLQNGIITKESKIVIQDLKNICAWKITLDREHNEFIKQVKAKSKLLRKLLILMRLEHEKVLSK